MYFFVRKKNVFFSLNFYVLFLFIRTVRNTVAYKSNNLIPRDNDVQELTIFVGKIKIQFHILLH